MPRANPIKKAIMGSDDQEYRGKAVKKRLRLKARISDFSKTVSSNKGEGAKGYKKPGAMK